MADQFFDWGAPGGQFLDTTTELSLGSRFSVSSLAPCRGIRFRIPGTLPSAPSPAFVSLWNVLDPVTPLGVGAFEWAAQTPNTWQIIALDDPVDVEPGEAYFAVYQTFELWAGTVPYTFPETQGLITMSSQNGWLKLGFGCPDLVSGANASFLVGPVLDVASGTEGSASASLGGLVAAASGARARAGTAAAALGGLTAAATGDGAPGVAIPGRLRVSSSDGDLRIAYTGQQLRATVE